MNSIDAVKIVAVLKAFLRDTDSKTLDAVEDLLITDCTVSGFKEAMAEASAIMEFRNILCRSARVNEVPKWLSAEALEKFKTVWAEKAESEETGKGACR